MNDKVKEQRTSGERTNGTRNKKQGTKNKEQEISCMYHDDAAAADNDDDNDISFVVV